MQIDRSRFLALVSAIGAYTACAGTTKDAAPVVIPPPPQPPPVASLPPIASPSPPPPPSSAPTPEPEPPRATTSRGVWAFEPSTPPKTCVAVKCPIGVPYDEMRRVVANECRSLDKILRPEAFQRVLACLTEKGAPNACETPRFGVEPGMCLEHWSEPPQLDPSTEAKCKTIVAQCSGPQRSVYAGSGALNMADCQGILSVTKPAAVPHMVHCIVEYCDQAPSLCWMDY